MIVSYRRVSTDRQDIGLDAQAEAIQAWISRSGQTFNPMFDYVEKQSGKNMKRPELQKAIAVVERMSGVLVVAKLDRLSRSVSDFATLIDRATKNNWTIVVCDLNIDMTTPSGRLIANIMASLAEWERSMIALRIKEALKQKAKQGIYPGRPASAEIVLMVKQLRSQGFTLREIAGKLRDTPTPAGGKQWYASTIRGMIGRAS